VYDGALLFRLRDQTFRSFQMKALYLAALTAALFTGLPTSFAQAPSTNDTSASQPAPPAPPSPPPAPAASPAPAPAASPPPAASPAPAATPSASAPPSNERKTATKTKKKSTRTTRQEIDHSIDSGTVPSRYRSQVPKEYQHYIPFDKQ
jgi:outer membrane biosynthesis protein TonB